MKQKRKINPECTIEIDLGEKEDGLGMKGKIKMYGKGCSKIDPQTIKSVTN